MKQLLSDDNWVVAKSCFRTLVQNNFNIISDSKLKLEDEVLILCGDYMDNLKIIDTRENISDKIATEPCT